jgi:nitrite transporter NirC
MYAETTAALGKQAAAKLEAQRASIVSHLVRSMLAGMYVGASIVLIFTIGAYLPPSTQKLGMGVCFGGALTFVIFGGSELFTGSNLVLTLGVLSGNASRRDLAANWVWTWVGNLLGSALVAALVVGAGVLDADPVKAFVLRVVETKMHLPAHQLVLRAVLANWLVCLAVWMSARTKSETARVFLIWWCMFTFIACGYEHSVANMTGLLLGLLLPHGDGVTWAGYAYNLSLATLGNVIGGAFFVGWMYWLGSPSARAKASSSSSAATADAAAPGASSLVSGPATEAPAE